MGTFTSLALASSWSSGMIILATVSGIIGVDSTFFAGLVSFDSWAGLLSARLVELDSDSSFDVTREREYSSLSGVESSFSKFFFMTFLLVLPSLL